MCNLGEFFCYNKKQNGGTHDFEPADIGGFL